MPQVINCNSDVDILKHFTDDWAQCSARLDESGASGAWTEGMDREMGLLHEHGCTVQQLEEFLMSIKIERELSDALKLASTRDAAVYILSDANTWFIDAILRANGLRDDIKCVCSNPVVFEECGRVRVRPFHTTPHPEGSSSPPNLCKGRVMDGWLRTGKRTRRGEGGLRHRGHISLHSLCLRLQLHGIEHMHSRVNSIRFTQRR